MAVTPQPTFPAHPRLLRQTRSSGFSLVEVVLAIGVVSFAFVAILGLLPAGMTQFRQAIDTTVCAQIAQRVIGDAQQTDFAYLIDETGIPLKPKANYAFRAPKKQKGAYRYFDEQGNEVVPSSGDSLSTAEKVLVVYHVITRVIPETAVPKTGTSTQDNTSLATVTVQVVFNPGNRSLPILSGKQEDEDEPNRELIDPKEAAKVGGFPSKTYGALVARNK